MNKVYMSFSSDIIHGGHLNILKKAAELGEVTVGILTDDVIASYKSFPILSVEERMELFSNSKYVANVVKQDTLGYEKNLYELRPNYVVHGDNWKSGKLAGIRKGVLSVLEEIGGELIEFPYTENETYVMLEEIGRAKLSMPDIRRGLLRRLLSIKKTLRVIEAHSGITGLIAEKTVVERDGVISSFDAMWVSSLCDSISKGKPDIELVDMSSRMRTIDDIMEVTTRPIIFDGDTGGQIEHFVYNIKTLERMGVSAVIIEDKIGLKRNSLFGTDIPQTQDTIEHFSKKISAGKAALKTRSFMIIARIESLILEKGIEDALARAVAYIKAGADGIMIHSRRKTPDEVFEFCDKLRAIDGFIPIVVVPTSYSDVTEEELGAHGVNVVIYANHLTRSAFPAMENAARLILENGRAKEADAVCMSINKIINLIPEN